MIGQELKRVREELGLSQKAFAERFGINLRSLSRYETGQVKPRGVTLRHLEKVLAEAKKLLSPDEEPTAGTSQSIPGHPQNQDAETEADFLLQELGAWVRRTVMRRPETLEQISAGVRRLINEVEGVSEASDTVAEQNKASPGRKVRGSAGVGG